MKNIEERPKFLQVTEDFWYLKKGTVIKLDERKERYYATAHDIGIVFDIIARLPDLFVEYKDKRQIEIKMVVTVEPIVTADDVNMGFVHWIERLGWTCGGSVKELES